MPKYIHPDNSKMFSATDTQLQIIRYIFSSIQRKCEQMFKTFKCLNRLSILHNKHDVRQMKKEAHQSQAFLKISF